MPKSDRAVTARSHLCVKTRCCHTVKALSDDIRKYIEEVGTAHSHASKSNKEMIALQGKSASETPASPHTSTKFKILAEFARHT
jgi:hypothetical protein